MNRKNTFDNYGFLCFIWRLWDGKQNGLKIMECEENDKENMALSTVGKAIGRFAATGKWQNKDVTNPRVANKRLRGRWQSEANLARRVRARVRQGLGGEQRLDCIIVAAQSCCVQWCEPVLWEQVASESRVSASRSHVQPFLPQYSPPIKPQLSWPSCRWFQTLSLCLSVSVSLSLLLSLIIVSFELKTETRFDTSQEKSTESSNDQGAHTYMHCILLELTTILMVAEETSSL
jgi:hypothetical protein